MGALALCTFSVNNCALGIVQCRRSRPGQECAPSLPFLRRILVGMIDQALRSTIFLRLCVTPSPTGPRPVAIANGVSEIRKLEIRAARSHVMQALT